METHTYVDPDTGDLHLTILVRKRDLNALADQAGLDGMTPEQDLQFAEALAGELASDLEERYGPNSVGLDELADTAAQDVEQGDDDGND